VDYVVVFGIYGDVRRLVLERCARLKIIETREEIYPEKFHYYKREYE
jgi:hypothetical protein